MNSACGPGPVIYAEELQGYYQNKWQSQPEKLGHSSAAKREREGTYFLKKASMQMQNPTDSQYDICTLPRNLPRR